jgi:hypothetical protein
VWYRHFLVLRLPSCLGGLHQGLSVFSVCIFEIAHCPCTFYFTWHQVPCFDYSVWKEIPSRLQSGGLLLQVQWVGGTLLVVLMVRSTGTFWNHASAHTVNRVFWIYAEVCYDQRHRDWWPYPPVGPASWTMGTEKLKLCTIGKKLFCTGPTGSAGQFFMLLLPSKIHRLNSVSTGNETVNIL